MVRQIYTYLYISKAKNYRANVSLEEGSTLHFTLTFSVAFNTCIVGTGWVVREHWVRIVLVIFQSKLRK